MEVFRSEVGGNSEEQFGIGQYAADHRLFGFRAVRRKPKDTGVRGHKPYPKRNKTALQ